MEKQKKKKDYDYKAVNLPQDLLDKVDDFIKNSSYYRSRADFVKSSIRLLLEKETRTEEDIIQDLERKMKKIDQFMIAITPEGTVIQKFDSGKIRNLGKVEDIKPTDEELNKIKEYEKQKTKSFQPTPEWIELMNELIEKKLNEKIKKK